MRWWLLLLGALASGALAAGGPVLSPQEAARHRGELVTIAGQVTEVNERADGIEIRVGRDPGVAVMVPAAGRGRLGQDVNALVGRAVEVTGFVSPPGEPLALRMERPENFVIAAGRHAAPSDEEKLRSRIRELEDEVARLRAQLPQGSLSAVTYGPNSPPHAPLPLYASQATVLAERGVPDRVEWGPRGRTLYYGRQEWIFDAQGQLIEMRGDR